MSTGIVFDTGALIALERGDRSVLVLLQRATQTNAVIHIPSGVVAQAWRGSPRQAPLARLLRRRHVAVPPLDAATARQVGVLLADSGTADVVDGSVIACARSGGDAPLTVVTSDPDDMACLDPRVPLVIV